MKRKRFRRKLKNAVLKTITAMAVLTLMLVMSSVNDGYIEMFAAMAALGWLYAFGAANDWFGLYDDKEWWE